MSKQIDYVKYNSDTEQVEVYYNGKIVEKYKYDLVTYLDETCNLYGSTYQGRKASYQKLTKSKQKPAVLVSLIDEVLLFPNKSLVNDDCVMINYYNIAKIVGSERRYTKIYFLNKSELLLGVDSRIIKGQEKRCSRFVNYLEQNIRSLDD